MLVGGGFDLLHVGHLHLLSYARSLADVLVVSVLSDKYIKTYKGDTKPIIPQKYRAALVASLKQVDFAYISDASSYNFETLSALKPDHLVYGKDPLTSRMSAIEEKANAVKLSFPSVSIHYLERHEDASVSTGAIVRRIRNL